MILRETLWTDEASGALQYSLAALDDLWELLCEFTYPCGPFHPVEDRRLLAHDEVRHWLRTCGHQQELPI